MNINPASLGYDDALLPDRLRDERTEAVPPEANRLVCYVDAAIVEQIFDVPQRKREADVHHHRKADDLGRSLEVPEGITHQKTLRNRANSPKRRLV